MSALPVIARRRGVGFAAAVGAVALLSGCAAGQRVETARDVAVVDGTNVQAGDCVALLSSCIALNAVSIQTPQGNSYAKGSQADLDLILVNSGHEDDQLIGVTSDGAADVSLYKDAATATTASGLAALAAAGSDSASASPSSDAPASTSAAATSGAATSGAATSGAATSGAATSGASSSRTSGAAESAAASSVAEASKSAAAAQSAAAASLSAAQAASAPLTSLTIPAGARISIGYGGDTSNVLVLSGLTQDLYPAQTIKITFTFAKAGQITATVPVHLSAGVTNPASIDVQPTSEG